MQDDQRPHDPYQERLGDQAERASGGQIGRMCLFVIFSLLFITVFVKAPGTGDVQTFLQWISDVRKLGVVSAFHQYSDQYPPLCFLVFGILARIADFLKAPDFIVLKFTIGLALLGCALGLARCRGRWEPQIGLVTICVLAINALFLGYIDVFCLGFVVWAFNCFQGRKWQLGAALFTIGCFVKWQPLIIAPFVALYLWPIPFTSVITRYLQGSIEYAKRIWPAVILILAVVLFFGMDPIRSTFYNAVTDDVMSGNALNLNWLSTAYLRIYGGVGTQGGTIRYLMNSAFDYPSIVLASRLLFYSMYISLLLAFVSTDRRFVDLIKFTILGYFAYFIFNIGVHENHLIVAAVLSIFWIFLEPRRALEGAILAIMANVNLVVFYGISGQTPNFGTVVFGLDATIYLAAFNVVFFFILWAPIMFELFRSLSSSRRSSVGSSA